MLTKLHKRGPGWYLADFEVAQDVAGLPGVKEQVFVDVNRPVRFELHRSHFPLMTHPEAVSELACVSALNPDWASRDAITEALGFKLRTTQHQAIDYMRNRSGTLLGDEMRLGKSLSAIMTHDPASGPFVIIAPLSTRAVWLTWLRRVFPDTPIGIMQSKTFDGEAMRKPIVFGHYDILPKWQGIMPIGTLVFDEAHNLTNKDALRTKGAFMLRARAERVIAMTGTPIWNMPPNLWAVLALVAPGAWGGYYDFCDRYAAPMPTAYGKVYTGTSNTDELRTRMTDIMLRRRWRDCQADLPPISRSVIVAEVTEAESKKLDIIMGSLRTDRTNTAGHLATYRKQVSFITLKVVEQEITKVTGAGEPVVVWTWHKETAERIARKHLPGQAGVSHEPPRFVIHGDVAVAKRDALMDAWRNTPNGVLIATMSVAQVGINLSHSKVAIFAELDWTPAIIAQTEMRTFDPSRAMDIRFVVPNHIVAQRIIRALISKLGAADPLGVGAAVDTIDALRDAVMGPRDSGDLDRLMEDFLASAA